MDDFEWIDVAREGGIPFGSFAELETDDHLIAVFNIDGNLYAIEDVCTHDGAELAGGPIQGDQIICPRHGARFCLRTGKALSAPAYEDISTFEVRIHEGRIQVCVPV
ncbi:MAG: non-heme iron oxygenase ferredoxin subunit [Gammaproteobacteria bacterium]